ncbi:MAG: cell division protein FtsQ/DivIB [Planctomycetaceae bacterium]
MALMRAILSSRLLWACVAVLASLGAARFLARELARDRRFLALPVRLEARAPAWADRAVVEPVLARLKAIGAINLFHPGFERIVRAAIAKEPAVARVGQVRRHWPRSYSVSFSLRRPYAVVAHAAGRIPVTREGVALPFASYGEVARDLWAIQGIDSPAPRPGQAWKDPRVDAAILAIVEIAPLLGELAPLGLEGVDAGQACDPLEGVVLVGANGLRVRWGRPGAIVGENSPERKAAFLRVVAGDPERARGYEVDVRYEEMGLRKSTAP